MPPAGHSAVPPLPTTAFESSHRPHAISASRMHAPTLNTGGSRGLGAEDGSDAMGRQMTTTSSRHPAGGHGGTQRQQQQQQQQQFGSSARSREEHLARLHELTGSASGGGAGGGAADGIKDKSKVIAELQEIARYLSVENAHFAEQVDHLRTSLGSVTNEAHAYRNELADLRETCSGLEQRDPGTEAEEAELSRKVAVLEDEIRQHLPIPVALAGAAAAAAAASASAAAAATSSSASSSASSPQSAPRRGAATSVQGAAAVEGADGLRPGGFESGVQAFAPPRKILAETVEGRCAILRSLVDQRHAELVAALKRRVARLEENASLARVVDAHGSLPDLLEQNRKLRDQNEALRLREMRFAPYALLRRRKLAECEPAFLRLLVTALQNELAASRRLIDKYGFERNPTLGLLVAAPEPIADPATLADVDAVFRAAGRAVERRQRSSGAYGDDGGGGEDNGDDGGDGNNHASAVAAPWGDDSPLLDAFAPADPSEPRNGGIGPGPDAAAEASLEDVAETLRQRNAILEAANAALVNEIALRDEVAQRQREVEGDRDDVISDLMGHRSTAKERRILELQQKNEKIVESENALLSTLAKKDKVILFQEGRSQETAREKQHLREETAALSRRLIALTKRCKDADRDRELARRQLSALHRAAMTMCLALVERLDIPIRSRSATVAYMFRDVFAVYARSVDAATRLQAAFRGAICRKRRGVDKRSIRYLGAAANADAAAPTAAAGTAAAMPAADLDAGGGVSARATPPLVVVLRGLPQPDGTLAHERRRFTFTYHRDPAGSSAAMASMTPLSGGDDARSLTTISGPFISIPGEPTDEPLTDSEGRAVSSADAAPESAEQRAWLRRVVDEVSASIITGSKSSSSSSSSGGGDGKSASAQKLKHGVFDDFGTVFRSRIDPISSIHTDVLWAALTEATKLAPAPPIKEPVHYDPVFDRPYGADQR
jgi:hypothetical protein